jgi:GNAT superfamily N-acetyltransferase
MRREVRLVEIMVLPERRGWGVGTATLDEILATAVYERLGFRKIGQDAVQYLTECG